MAFVLISFSPFVLNIFSKQVLQNIQLHLHQFYLVLFFDKFAQFEQFRNFFFKCMLLFICSSLVCIYWSYSNQKSLTTHHDKACNSTHNPLFLFSSICHFLICHLDCLICQMVSCILSTSCYMWCTSGRKMRREWEKFRCSFHSCRSPVWCITHNREVCICTIWRAVPVYFYRPLKKRQQQ